MDILYVGTLPPHPGGSAVVAGQVLPRLVRRGHRVRAVSGTTIRPVERLVAAQGATLENVRTFTYPVTSNHVDTARISSAMLRADAPHLRVALRRALELGPPDVLLSGRSDACVAVAVLSRALDVPFVQVHHSSYGRGASPATDHRVRRLPWHRRASAFIHVARHLGEVFEDHGVPVITAPNAVEIDRFRPRPRDRAFAARWGIPPDAFVVLHASNLKPVKRAQDLVAAAPDVFASVPDAHVVFVGDGPARQPSVEMIRAAGLERRVSFVGWRDRAEMPAWYSLADVVVMPSESEALSLAMLETMASGRALVATQIPGARELVTDGHDALLVPVGDVAALGRAIVRVAVDAPLRDRLGAAARATVRHRALDDTVAGWETALRLAVARPVGTTGRPVDGRVPVTAIR